MKRFFEKLRHIESIKFRDKKMEQEYNSIKAQNVRNDFKAIVLYTILINTVTILLTAHKVDCVALVLSCSSIAIALFFSFLQCLIKKGVQYFTLGVLIGFIVLRFVGIAINYDNMKRNVVFYVSYILAVNQILILSVIQSLPIRIITIFLSLGFRVGILALVDPSASNPYFIIRQIFMDLFLVYIVFSKERIERRVFQNFFENRDELIKFKELLADSLPQSLIVIDLKTQKKLFSNNKFQSSFLIKESLDVEDTEIIATENQMGMINLSHLRMDLSTLREVDTQQSLEGSFVTDSEDSFCLKDLLKKLVEEQRIDGKALSINSVHKTQDRQKTFELILKKVMWDRIEAIAIIFNETTYQENLIALKLANSNKDQILATVSHELRTPLHGIIGLLEIVETKVKDKEMLGNLSLCKDNAYLLSSLVNSLLDLQQLSTGKLRLNEAKIDVTKTLKDVIQLFKFQSDQKNIDLELQINIGGDPFIITDENRFKQILINLIGNAIKFTFKGGVTVNVTEDSEDLRCLIVSIRDTGIGIKQEDLGKLFRLYGKLVDSSGVNSNGVGLGLTISNTLAVLLNGERNDRGIKVESEYGKGSRFSFKILKSLQERNNNVSLEIAESTERQTNIVSNVKTEKLLPNLNTTQESIELSIADESIEKLPSFNVQQRSSFYQPGLHQRNASLHKFEMQSKEETGLRLKTQSHPETKECILVVDDNPFNVLIARSLLKDIGFEVKSASGGQEAIQIVQECEKEGVKIKIIFMDCQMPVMDGYETARMLKKMMEKGEVPTVPIFAWTANNGEKDIIKCYESGMTGYLSKPTTKEHVIKAIPK